MELRRVPAAASVTSHPLLIQAYQPLVWLGLETHDVSPASPPWKGDESSSPTGRQAEPQINVCLEERATTKGRRTEKIEIMEQKRPIWRLYRNKPVMAQPFSVTATKGTFKSLLLQLF